MAHGYSSVLAVLGKHDILVLEDYIRTRHHEQVNRHIYMSYDSEYDAMKRLEKEYAARRKQEGMKLDITFPGTHYYVFPFHAITFDMHSDNNTACFEVCADGVVVEKVKEALRDILAMVNLELHEAGGRVYTFFYLIMPGVKEAMPEVVSCCCAILRSLIPSEEKASLDYFDAAVERINKAVELFIFYNEVGFDKLYADIEFPELVEQCTDMTPQQVGDEQIAYGLYKALQRKNDAVAVLREIFKTGISPDYSCSRNRPSLLQNVSNKQVQTPAEMEYWLGLLDLLLEFRANSAVNSVFGRTCARNLLEKYALNSTPLQEEFAVKALYKMAHANPTGERILMHSYYLASFLGIAIAKVNEFYERRNDISPEVQSVEILGFSIFFTMCPDKKSNRARAKPCRIKVTTKELARLQKHEIEALFAIFSERFAELAQQEGVSLVDYFRETISEALEDKTTEAMVDLVEVVAEGRICAFNMFQIKRVQVEGQLSLVHRILLIAASLGTEQQKSISYYKGFMSMLQYLRGFVLQQRYPNFPVYTVLEGLNAKVYEQLANLGFTYYPPYACMPESVLLALAQQVYRNYDVSYEQGCLQVDDVLAAELPVREQRPLSDCRVEPCRGRVAARNFYRFFHRQQYATVISFLNSPTNLLKLESALGLLMAAEMLRGYIHVLAEMVQYNGAYAPRTARSRL